MSLKLGKIENNSKQIYNKIIQLINIKIAIGVLLQFTFNKWT